MMDILYMVHIHSLGANQATFKHYRVKPDVFYI